MNICQVKKKYLLNKYFEKYSSVEYNPNRQVYSFRHPGDNRPLRSIILPDPPSNIRSFTVKDSFGNLLGRSIIKDIYGAKYLVVDFDSYSAEELAKMDKKFTWDDIVINSFRYVADPYQSRINYSCGNLEHGPGCGWEYKDIQKGSSILIYHGLIIELEVISEDDIIKDTVFHVYYIEKMNERTIRHRKESLGHGAIVR